MKQKEISDGNRLIAEFMGIEIKSISGQGDFAWVWKKRELKKDYVMPEGYTIMTLPKERLDEISEYNWHNIEDFINGLKYNRSWDWIMQVLEKIEKLGYHTRICFDGFGSWMQIHYGVSIENSSETKALNLHGTKIENTFKSVVQFITWYNKNKKKD